MLAKRMLMLFFRDKLSVFFSLMSALIILMLYILFLGNMMEQNLENAIGFWSDQIRVTMASVIMAGMVAVTSITSCLGSLSVAVKDKQESGRDFMTSPVPRWKISLGYMLGAGMVGLVMTSVALILVLVYIVAIGGSLPTGADFVRLVLTVVLSSLCGNAMMFFATLFIKSINAFSGFTSIVGTLIGFIMGVFIPIGTLPNAMQWAARVFPMSHGAAMFRQVLADRELATMFHGAPEGYLENFRLLYGLAFEYGDFKSDFWFSAAILAGFTVVFFVLSVLVMRFRKASAD